MACLQESARRREERTEVRDCFQKPTLARPSCAGGKFCVAAGVALCKILLPVMKEYADSQNRARTRFLLATLLAVGCGLLLVWLALLRENQAFWTHAAGYPMWLRNLVLWTFMSLFGGTVGLLCKLSMACCARLRGRLRFFAAESILILLGWGMVTASGCIAFQNNLSNLIHGVPLHHHQPVR